MQNLLIVDDEPNIVEGLVNRIEDLKLESLMVQKAYSGSQALSILQNNKADIVLSDIRMAGLDGLELMEKIADLWPHIRFIFLTGYNDFDYIHRASKSPLFAGYLLKTEGDDVILGKVMEELERGQAAVLREKNILSLQDQLSRLNPVLHRIYLENLLKGPVSESAPGDDIPGLLELRVSPERPILLALGSIMKDETPMQRFRDMMLADQLLAQEAGAILDHECVLCGEHIVWFLQPAAHARGRQTFGEDDTALTAYIHAVVQSVQQQLNDDYGLPVTYIISSHRVPLAELHVQYELLRTILSMLKLDSQSLMIVDQSMGDDSAVSAERIGVLEKISFSNKIRQLENWLETDTADQLRNDFQALFSDVRPGQTLRTEEGLALIMLLLSVAKRHNLADWLSENPLCASLSPGCRTDRRAFLDQYLEVCRQLCQMRADLELLGKQKIVDKINRYIDEHLEDYNLSLAQVARISCFNPAYLSRFYKQHTGANLSDYINGKKLELAKTLLAEGMLIRDVAEKTGYASPSSFILFFKRNLGVTPRQYQSKCNFQ